MENRRVVVGVVVCNLVGMLGIAGSKAVVVLVAVEELVDLAAAAVLFVDLGTGVDLVVLLAVAEAGQERVVDLSNKEVAQSG